MTEPVKHTPGPWAVNEDGWKVESEKEHGWVNDGWGICVTHGSDREANARLIAAAPELLQALKESQRLWWEYGQETDPEISVPAHHRDMERQIEVAIAKAEGH